MVTLNTVYFLMRTQFSTECTEGTEVCSKVHKCHKYYLHCIHGHAKALIFRHHPVSELLDKVTTSFFPSSISRIVTLLTFSALSHMGYTRCLFIKRGAKQKQCKQGSFRGKNGLVVLEVTVEPNSKNSVNVLLSFEEIFLSSKKMCNIVMEAVSV